MMEHRHAEPLARLLKERPRRPADILRELGISQPTFSRLWKTIEDGITLGAGRARRYALRRHVPGVATPIVVFRVDAAGQVEAIGTMDPLQGGFYALALAQENDVQVFEGMPYFLHDLRPQGFLGRLEPGRHRDLDLPSDILRWTDEQVLKYVARRSEQAPGNLILGDESYARFLAPSDKGADTLIAAADRATRFPALAAQAMQGEPAGSSAGGEQPKFTAVIERPDSPDQFDHVIVKFSPPLDTDNGRRWGDLLICEHLALAVLRAHDIAAATTTIIEAGGRVFLEVVRFDRAGLHGRLPMATFAALDGDLGMMDQGWTAVAHALGQRGELAVPDIETVEILDLYGAMIGNTDKHHGNIAVAWAFGQRHTLLPAYDMLPMLYRPNTHGEVIPRAWLPHFSAGLALRHVPPCQRMAQAFWRRVLDDTRISSNFKADVATPHLHTLVLLTR
jgi:hypothetical protein